MRPELAKFRFWAKRNSGKCFLEKANVENDNLGFFEMFQNPSFLAVKNETAKRSNLAIFFFILLDLSENLLFKIMAIRINLLIVGKAWLWPQNIIFVNLHSKKWDFLNGPTPTSFCLFSLFSNTIYPEKTVVIQWGSNADRQRRRRAR